MKKQKTHYIDNKKFYAEMVIWKKKVKEAENSDDPRPPITEYIGECIMKIADHLSQKPNFANYPFKEEMIGDGIENCLMYAHNFNPRKSKNPFSYFTQIIYFAFLRRIEKEKKQVYVKLKMTELLDDGTVHKWLKHNYLEEEKQENPFIDILESSRDFENKKKKEKTKVKKKIKRKK